MSNEVQVEICHLNQPRGPGWYQKLRNPFFLNYPEFKPASQKAQLHLLHLKTLHSLHPSFHTLRSVLPHFPSRRSGRPLWTAHRAAGGAQWHGALDPRAAFPAGAVPGARRIRADAEGRTCRASVLAKEGGPSGRGGLLYFCWVSWALCHMTCCECCG